ncbi:hypothetical protein [Streptomyces tanashiensis]
MTRIVPSAHGRWPAARCPGAEPRFAPADGHISVLGAGPAALERLVGRAV